MIPIITRAFNTSSASIYLTWLADVTELNGAPLLGYSVFYREINSRYKPDVVTSVGPAVTEAWLENLDKFTSYFIRVLAFTKYGNGVPSERVTVTTDEDGKHLVDWPEVSVCLFVTQ